MYTASSRCHGLLSKKAYYILTPVDAGPIIGIAWTTGLTKGTSWVPETDKILQLVMILGSAGMCISSLPRDTWKKNPPSDVWN